MVQRGAKTSAQRRQREPRRPERRVALDVEGHAEQQILLPVRRHELQPDRHAVLAEARRRSETLLVQLTVTEGNAAAQALYASCGFISFGTEPLAVRLGDGYVAKVHLWCDLGKLAAPSSSR